MARRFAMSEFGQEFFDSAPIIYRIDTLIPVSPQRAWAELTNDNTLDWCRAINSVDFTSSKPHGVGTTRTAVLGHGRIRLHERYFLWEDHPEQGHYRNAFQVIEANLPGLRRFGELTEVRPSGAGTHLCWTFAVELATSSKVVHSVLATAFRVPLAMVKADTIEYFGNLSHT
jgi:hypothetical protein